MIDQLQVSDQLKRVMHLAPSVELERIEAWRERLCAEVHPQVPALVAEAWSTRLLSPRASVALLRSVAELVVATFVAGGGKFHEKLLQLEGQWDAAPVVATPAGRREGSWRAGVLSCLHTIRDLGNRFHADSVVGRRDVELAHSSSNRLLEAVLRLGPLDPPLPGA